jgi:hypothetical protein
VFPFLVSVTCKSLVLACAPAAAIVLAIVAPIDLETPRCTSWDTIVPENCCTTNVPSTATPSVLLIWRLVLTMDEPRPARVGGVAERTAAVSGLSMRPKPMPSSPSFHQMVP